MRKSKLIHSQESCMAIILDEFIKIEQGKEWSPAINVDCGLTLANWLIFLGYDDTAKNFRGAYSKGIDQIKLIIRKGGLVAIVDECLLNTGIVQVTTPKIGDIAVIGSNNINTQYCAIYTKDGFITMTEKGFVLVCGKIHKIWGIRV